MTTPVSSSGGTTIASILADAKAKAAAASAPANQMGKDTFLKLLVAQMKYQNPMSPTDGTQFLAQTAQFSMVEKLDDLATQNAQLITAGELSSATALVGRTVSWPGTDATVKTGVVTGARFTSTGPVLTVGKDEVALTAVTSVTGATGSPGSGTTGSTGTTGTTGTTGSGTTGSGTTGSTGTTGTPSSGTTGSTGTTGTAAGTDAGGSSAARSGTDAATSPTP